MARPKKIKNDPKDYHSYYPEGNLAYFDTKSREVKGVIFTPNKERTQEDLDRLKRMFLESQQKPNHEELKKYP